VWKLVLHQKHSTFQVRNPTSDSEVPCSSASSHCYWLYFSTIRLITLNTLASLLQTERVSNIFCVLQLRLSSKDRYKNRKKKHFRIVCLAKWSINPPFLLVENKLQRPQDVWLLKSLLRVTRLFACLLGTLL